MKEEITALKHQCRQLQSEAKGLKKSNTQSCMKAGKEEVTLIQWVRLLSSTILIICQIAVQYGKTSSKVRVLQVPPAQSQHWAFLSLRSCLRI